MWSTPIADQISHPRCQLTHGTSKASCLSECLNRGLKFRDRFSSRYKLISHERRGYFTTSMIRRSTFCMAIRPVFETCG